MTFLLNKHFSKIFCLTILLAAVHESAITKVNDIIHIQLLNTQGYPYFLFKHNRIGSHNHILLQVQIQSFFKHRAGMWVKQLVEQETCDLIMDTTVTGPVVVRLSQ